MTHKHNLDLKAELAEAQIAVQHWEQKYLEAMKRPVCSGRCAQQSARIAELETINDNASRCIAIQAESAKAANADAAEDRARALEAAELQALMRAEAAALRAVAGAHVKDNIQLGEENDALRAEVERSRAESDAALAQTRADWFAELSAANARTEAAEQFNANYKAQLAEARALLVRCLNWTQREDELLEHHLRVWLAANPESPYPTLGHSGADEVFERLRDHRGQSSLAEANPESPRAAAQDARWNMPEGQPRAAAERAVLDASSMIAESWLRHAVGASQIMRGLAPLAAAELARREEPDVDVSDWTMPRIERRGPTEAAERAVLDACAMAEILPGISGHSDPCIQRGEWRIAKAELARRAFKP